MLDKKIETELKLTGLAELVEQIASLQAEIDMFGSFANEVLISVLMPEHVRYFFEDDYPGRAGEALDALTRHMHDYRKILEFLRLNKIDVNQILSDNESKTLS